MAQKTVLVVKYKFTTFSSDHPGRLLSLYNRRNLHFRSLGFVFTVKKFWQGSPFNGVDTAKKKNTIH